jgi:hypothetical protein
MMNRRPTPLQTIVVGSVVEQRDINLPSTLILLRGQIGKLALRSSAQHTFYAMQNPHPCEPYAYELSQSAAKPQYFCIWRQERPQIKCDIAGRKKRREIVGVPDRFHLRDGGFIFFEEGRLKMGTDPARSAPSSCIQQKQNATDDTDFTDLFHVRQIRGNPCNPWRF